MTTWWWIRHGPTHEKGIVGWRDVPADLSDTAQIERLNRFLPRDALVIASDLIRASATADKVSEGRTRLANFAEIKELNFGQWDGELWSDVADKDPDLSRAYWETPGPHRAPNGESWHDLQNRIIPFKTKMSKSHQNQNIIAVAHFGVILCALQHALGIATPEVFAHKIDNFSVTKLTYRNDTWSVDLINYLP